MWKKRIIERECAWSGVNGRNFDTTKYIDVMFYSMQGVEKRDGYVIHGAIGAVVGGSGSINLALSSLNGTLKSGQPKVTEQEIKDLIEKFAKEIETDPQRYKFTPEPYPVDY